MLDHGSVAATKVQPDREPGQTTARPPHDALNQGCQIQSQRGPKLKIGTTSRAKQVQHLLHSVDRLDNVWFMKK